MSGVARRVAEALLRSPSVNATVRRLANLRGHRLVLVYHRLGPPAPHGCEVIPSVPAELFRAQLQALGEVVDIVPLDEIAGDDVRRTGRRPAASITFDDDLASHAEHALPVLRALGLPATFFLSGRALHGRGPYWFQYLEAVLIARGAARTAALLGLPQTDTGNLTMMCAQNTSLQRRITEFADDLPKPEVLGRESLAGLGAAGMAIGFHTVGHDLMPDLDDAALGAAASNGRAELAKVTGGEVRYFAYPYGKADGRSAAAVRSAGFQSAFTGQPRPVRPRDDRFRIGRWEPGPLGVDELLVKLALRLHRAAPPPRKEM